MPRPLVPPQVASPINLLNPDRYEFYTFNDSGELVKRLMTMKEIQSIVAGGETDGAMLMQSSPLSQLHQEPQANIQDIVTNVQNVLQKEMEEKKNSSLNVQNKLDTPDTSVSWSHILPAIFGNTGDQIVPDRTHVIGMTPDSVLYEKTERTPVTNKPIFERTTAPLSSPAFSSSSSGSTWTTSAATATTSNRLKQKPSSTLKPTFKTSVKPSPSAAHKIKITEKKKPGKINAEPDSTEAASIEFKEASGTNYYVPPTTIAPLASQPTKYVIIRKRPITTTEEPQTAGTLDDIIQTMSTISQAKIDSSSTASPSSLSSWHLSSSSSAWPSTSFSSSRKPSRHPTTTNPTRSPTTILYSSIKAQIQGQKQQNQGTFGGPTKTSTNSLVSSTAGLSSSSTNKFSSFSSSNRPSSTPSTTLPPASYTFKTSASTAAGSSTSKRPAFSSSKRPISSIGTTTTIITTTDPPPQKQEPIRTTEYPTKWISTDSTESESDSTENASTELPSLFDSHNSLNQIIESLKDEATTTQNGLLLANDDNIKNFFESTTLDEAAADTSTFSDDLIYPTLNINKDNTVKPYIPSMGKIPSLHQVFKDNAAFIADRTPSIGELQSSLFDAEFKQTDQSIPIEDNTPAYTLIGQNKESDKDPENHKVVQEVDNFIQNNADRILDSMTVKTVNMDHNMPIIPSNLTMSEFAEQAATVASILSNENTERVDELHLRESFDNVISQIQEDIRTTTEEDDVPETTTLTYRSQILNVEALPLVNDTNDSNKLEMTVVKKTSSISSSANSNTEKPIFVPTTAGVFTNKVIETKRPTSDDSINYVQVPLVNDAFDRNTEISIQADVHETVHSIKIKRPPTTFAPYTEELTTKGPQNDDGIGKTTQTYVEIASSNPSTQGPNEPASIVQTTLGPADSESFTTETTVGIGMTDYTTEASESSGSGEFTESYSEDASYSTAEDSSGETVSVVQSDELGDSSEASFYENTSSDEEPEKFSKLYEDRTENRIMSTTNEASEYQTTTTRLVEATEKEEKSSTDVTTLKDFEDLTSTTPGIETTTEFNLQNDRDAVQSTTIEHNTEDLSTTLMQEMEQKWELLTKNKDVIVHGSILDPKPTIPPRREFEELALLADKRSNTTTSSTRKEDSQEIEEDQKVAESQTNQIQNEEHFANLGESTKPATKRPDLTTTYSGEITKPSKLDNRSTLPDKPIKTGLQKLQQKLHSSEQKIYHISQTKPSIKLPPALSTLKLKVGNTSTKKPPPVKLDPAPKQALGLEESTVNANEDILEFTKMCNELAFSSWRALNSEGISSARSLVISPFALNSMLAMIFLGARGSTSGEMNEMLRLDDMVTFNPHVIFHNISESAENAKDSPVATSAFVRELFSDRNKGKFLAFYKDKAQQFYSGHVEEVNFNIINDIIRRRTNLLVKRHTAGKIPEYLKTNNVWANMPLAGLTANIFQTDCSKASTVDRDGEMFFQVLPAIRQRRLVPIPAAVWPNGFTAGYDPELDATAVAFGSSVNTISTIFVMPGQQGHSAPGDNLERLESVLMINAVSKNAWRRLLTTLMERPGLEVQMPRFSHRSFINATASLQKMGLKTIFDLDKADLRGLTGSATRDMFISDMIQINTFSTCGEEKIADQHHIEMYPAPPIRSRSLNLDDLEANDETQTDAPETIDIESQRAFHDPLLDLKYLELPLPLRPRQARIPEAPRLRFDKPFLYFVRHNPTGMILYMGRFNPRLLP